MNAGLTSVLLAVCGQADAVAVDKVVLSSGKEQIKAVCCRPAGTGPFPALLLVHGDFGLTTWAQQQARRLAERGYVTLAVDLYRGELAKDIEEAHILERGLPEERALRDLKAGLDYLVRRPDVRAERLGIIGFDMGGGYALLAATTDPRLRAAVICYGKPITDPAVLAKMQASVLGVFAGKDEGISPEILNDFRAALGKAGKSIAGLRVVPDVDNGFLDPANPYATRPAPAEAVAQTWGWIEEYFAATLKSR